MQKYNIHPIRHVHYLNPVDLTKAATVYTAIFSLLHFNIIIYSVVSYSSSLTTVSLLSSVHLFNLSRKRRAVPVLPISSIYVVFSAFRANEECLPHISHILCPFDKFRRIFHLPVPTLQTPPLLLHIGI